MFSESRNVIIFILELSILQHYTKQIQLNVSHDINFERIVLLNSTPRSHHVYMYMRLNHLIGLSLARMRGVNNS